MSKILIISGHTDLNDSVANKIILDELHNAFPKAEMNILSEEYPDFHIDVDAERKKAEAADIIVWQFPVFWYSMPSLLHRWVEDVCVHGWAHGSTGNALKGKKLIPSYTTGAPESAYSKEVIGFDIHQVMDPQLVGTANLCKMDLQPSVITFGVSYGLRSDPAKLSEIKTLARNHAERLINEINNLNK